MLAIELFALAAQATLTSNGVAVPGRRPVADRGQHGKHDRHGDGKNASAKQHLSSRQRERCGLTLRTMTVGQVR